MLRIAFLALLGRACFAAENSSTVCDSSRPSVDSECTALLQRGPATGGALIAAQAGVPDYCYEEEQLFFSSHYDEEHAPKNIHATDGFGRWGAKFVLRQDGDSKDHAFIMNADGKFLSDNRGELRWVSEGREWEIWKVIDVGDGEIHLMSALMHEHLAVHADGSIYLSPHRAGWETFTTHTWPDPNICGKKATTTTTTTTTTAITTTSELEAVLPDYCSEEKQVFVTSHYDEEHASQNINATDGFGRWGAKLVLRLDGDSKDDVFIMNEDGKYLSDNRGELKWVSTGQAWEVWEVIDAGNGDIHLNSALMNDYLAVHADGSIYLSPSRADWETFTVHMWPDPKICGKKTTNWFQPATKDSKPEPVTKTSEAGSFAVASYNVYWQNFNYKAQAKLVLETMQQPQILNIQEAIEEMAPNLVKELNDATPAGRWALANPWTWDHWWCGLTVYRSDIWDLQWHKEVGVKQTWDTRGVCGSLLKRKSDGLKLCVWGTHPLWKPCTNHWAKHVIWNSAYAIKECSRMGGRSIFMGDMNTFDTEAIRTTLEHTTGLSWGKAYSMGYDQIYMETGPNPVGEASNGWWSEDGGQKGCGIPCQNKHWGYSDHPAVRVEFNPAP